MNRRNTIVFLTTSVLSCSVLLAEPIQNVNELPMPSPAATIQNVISDSTPISKEILLKETYDFSNAMRYEKMINSDANPIITTGLIAQILCDYIGQAPIYLKGEGSVPDPYIGRLMLEGIWCNEGKESTKTPTYGEWHELVNRCNLYMQDKEFRKSALDGCNENLKKQIVKWRELENKPRNFSKVSLGKLTKDANVLKYDGKVYPLYNLLSMTYVSTKDLKNMGFNIEIEKDQTKINNATMNPSRVSVSKENGKIAYLNTKKVFIGNLQTYSLVTADDVLIPVKTLQVYFNMENVEKNWAIKTPLVTTSQAIEINHGLLKNISDEVLDVKGTMLFWNGEKIIQESLHVNDLAPTQSYPIPTNLYALDGNTIYLTTIIQDLKGVTIQISRPNQYAQPNEYLYKQYELALKIEQEKIAAEKKKVAPRTLEELFPPSLIMGSIRYNTNGFKPGEKVEITMAEEGRYYYARKGLQVIKIPWGSVSIPPNPKVEKKQAEVKQIEAYINSQNFSSRTDYLVWTDLYRQRTYIFKGKKNAWKLHKDFLCSTGKNITPTPRGTYELQSYVPYFGVNKGYRCKNAIQISGDYLYHSIIFDKTGTYLLEGKGVLGQRASQGCIRFSEENSAWFYKNMPLGTKVWIN